MPDEPNRLVDSRRVPGASWWNDGPAVLLDLRTSDPERAVHAWHTALDALLAVCPVPGLGRRCVRVYPGGATVGFEAPGSVLYDAVDLNELAAEVALRLRSFESATEKARRLAPDLAASFDTPLEAFVDGGRQRGVNVLIGEKRVTLGSGVFAQTFDAAALPHALPDGLRDIPLALVTGTNGKTTTTRLIRRMLDLAGFTAGHTSTEGVFVGTEQIVGGDFAGPEGARRLLRHPGLAAAVLETSRGGLLRRGLAVQRARVAVVTNVGADHFGDYGVQTVEDVATAKLVVAKALVPGAPLVVNADDPVLWPAARALSERTGVPLAPFSLGLPDDGMHAEMQRSGRGAWLDDGRISALLDGEAWDLGPIEDLPLAFGGAAMFNVQNALAALLAAHALTAPVAAIEDALVAFGASPDDNPGRMNVHPYRGATVVVDYGHNDDGIAATVPVIGPMPSTRRRVLISQAGDRSDDDNRRMAAQILRLAPDDVAITELPGYERGRAVGETSESLARGFEACGMSRERLSFYDRASTGAEALLAAAQPGDLIVLFLHDDRDAVLAALRKG